MYSHQFLHSFYTSVNDSSTSNPTSNKGQGKKLPQVLYKCRFCDTIVDSAQEKKIHRDQMHFGLPEGATLFDSFKSKAASGPAKADSKPKKKVETPMKGKTQAKPKTQPKAMASGVKKAKGKTIEDRIHVTISRKRN